MEFGARSDHWPAVDAKIRPYVAEDFPEPFTSPDCDVHVLAPVRTFWEKATILHKWHHTPAMKSFKDRQSRHYYDLVRMYQHPSTQRAIQDTQLLAQVVRHKEVFFEDKWARYSEARPGTLRLVPPHDRLPELESDYRRMNEMFFSDPPTFEELLDVLREMEV